MTILSPWSLLLCALLAVLGAVGGWKAANDHRDALELADARGKTEALEAVAHELSKIKITQKNTTQILEKEVRIEKQYQECKHSPEALKALNSALVPGGTK